MPASPTCPAAERRDSLLSAKACGPCGIVSRSAGVRSCGTLADARTRAAAFLVVTDEELGPGTPFERLARVRPSMLADGLLLVVPQESRAAPADWLCAAVRAGFGWGLTLQPGVGLRAAGCPATLLCVSPRRPAQALFESLRRIQKGAM